MNCARKHRDDIGQLDVPNNLSLARALLDREVLIADFQARAVALQLIVNPSLRRADPVHRIVLRREHVARPEAFELLQRCRDPLFRDRIDDLLHGRVQPRFRRLRECRICENYERAEDRKACFMGLNCIVCWHRLDCQLKASL